MPPAPTSLGSSEYWPEGSSGRCACGPAPLLEFETGGIKSCCCCIPSPCLRMLSLWSLDPWRRGKTANEVEGSEGNSPYLESSYLKGQDSSELHRNFIPLYPAPLLLIAGGLFVLLRE